MRTFVTFKADDRAGLWKKGDKAEWLGPETPAIPDLITLRLATTRELITLHDPYGRGLIEEISRIEPFGKHRHTHTIRDGKPYCVYCGEELEL